MPRGIEGTEWSRSTHAGSSLRVLANTTDSLGWLPKMQLIILDTTVFSFIEDKTLVPEITITQGQEDRSDIQIMRSFESPRCIMLLTLTFPILFSSIYPIFLGQRNKNTMLLLV